jgi:hypothetical protein
MNVDASPSVAEGTPGAVSPILSSISVGAILNISLPGGTLGVLEFDGAGLISPAATSDYDFTVTMYSFNGENEAKISLVQGDSPDGTLFWTPTESAAAGNAITVAEGEPGQFVLTDDGSGGISMQNTFAPPDPNLAVIQPGGFPPYLAYGGQKSSGPFTIEVVG